MSIKRTLCLGKTRTLEEVIESCRDNFLTEVSEDALNTLVDECALTRVCLADWASESQNLLCENRIDDPQAVGFEIEETVSRLLSAFAQIDEWRQQLSPRFVVDSSDFEGPYKQLQRMKQEWPQDWPLMDDELRERSLADLQEGRFRSAKDILDELQRQDTAIH